MGFDNSTDGSATSPYRWVPRVAFPLVIRPAALTLGALSLGWGVAAVQLTRASLRAPFPETDELMIFTAPMFCGAVLGCWLTILTMRGNVAAANVLGWGAALAVILGVGLAIPALGRSGLATLTRSPWWWAGLAHVAIVAVASWLLLRHSRRATG